MVARRVDNILQLIGDTPIIRINRVTEPGAADIYVKLESMNPGGSVKDRIGLSMIEAAEKSGELVPGKAVLEASSGNTAIGLAMACAVKGYQLVVTMAASASVERRKILRAYGAEIILTPGHLSTDGAIEEAYKMAREEPDRYVLVDQYNNDANWEVHYRTTGREIYDATDGKVSVVVITLGTTGTLMGATRALRELNPKIRVVGVEPFKGHKIQGLKNMKESYPPGIFDPALPDEIVNVEDEPAYEMARRLAREEGIFVGMSAGAAMRVALDEAKKLKKGMVVAMLPDGGERYLSTSLFVSEKTPEPLRFYNTLTRKVDDFVPVQPGKVGMYTCGPSLDGAADLSLCRRLAFSDLLRRYLEHRGFEVKHAVNLGDIDDRTVAQCLEAGEPLADFARRWEDVFFQDLETLRIKAATAYPRASEHVQDMVDQARELLDKGVAYEKLRSIYFSIGRFPEYGKLSGVDPEQVNSGVSTVYDYYEKDNPRDFALFKRSTLAELKAGIYWNTPWGAARPGWHVECSTMASKHLGQPFDIHTASADLLFPHGDNEIAVAESLTGKPLVNCWMHCEVISAEGKKMSRASGNQLTLRDLIEKGHTAAAVRYWLLSTHYRTVLVYSDEELAAATRNVERLNMFVQRLRFSEGGESCDELDQMLFGVRHQYHEGMDTDLSISRALGHLFAFVRRINGLMDEGKLTREQLDRIVEFMRAVNDALGVIDCLDQDVDAEVLEKVKARDKARAEKDFEQADKLRAQLSELGYELFDTPHGTRWKRV
jgi:cysteinyl-tRNA synthetase